MPHTIVPVGSAATQLRYGCDASVTGGARPSGKATWCGRPGSRELPNPGFAPWAVVCVAPRGGWSQTLARCRNRSALPRSGRDPTPGEPPGLGRGARRATGSPAPANWPHSWIAARPRAGSRPGWRLFRVAAASRRWGMRISGETPLPLSLARLTCTAHGLGACAGACRKL